MNIPELENIMQQKLISLGLSHWTVILLPGESETLRGKTSPSHHLIEIYDTYEKEAWQTLCHEIVEIRLRDAIKPYRILVNKLIEGYQEIVDLEKDQFIESIVKDFRLQDKS